MSLTDKQRAFIDEYLINGFNALKAYKKAYPDASEESAKASGSRLLENVNIKAALEEARKEIKDMSRMSKADKLEYIEKILNKDKELTRDQLKALEIHNKMTGDNEPDKIEHSGSGFNLTIEVPEEDK